LTIRGTRAFASDAANTPEMVSLIILSNASEKGENFAAAHSLEKLGAFILYAAYTVSPRFCVSMPRRKARKMPRKQSLDGKVEIQL
jgi:hypothetical protein